MTVMRHPKFILREIANAELLEKAIELLPEGKDWWLVYPNHDDISQSQATGDKTYQGLRDAFERFENKCIAIGFDDDFSPFLPPNNNEKILEAGFG